MKDLENWEILVMTKNGHWTYLVHTNCVNDHVPEGHPVVAIGTMLIGKRTICQYCKEKVPQPILDALLLAK